MFCKYCGKGLIDKSEFCTNCGKKQDNKQNNNLIKLYKITGNSSIGLGVFGIISGVIVGYKPEFIILDTLVASFLNFPRIYFGLKIRNFSLSSPQYILKVSKWMAIYLGIYGLINFVAGMTGLLYWPLIYLYFLSYKKTKESLINI